MAVASLLTSLEDFAGAPTLPGYGGGQAAGVNDDVIIEGAQSAGRRVDNTVDKGFGASFTAADLSAAGEHVKVWLFVTQWAEVTQVQVRISSGVADDHELPTGEFPELGGFVPVWVDVSRAPEVGGSANEASISEVGVLIDIGDVGGNAANLILDEITHGTSGLEWTGVGGDVDDFLTFETTNREGVVVQTAAGVALYFRLESGDGTTATSFTCDKKLIAPDQALVAADAVGLSVDLTLAGDTFTGADGGGLESADPAAATTRPDFIVSGTAGTATLETGFLLLGLRLIELTSAVTITGGTYDTLAMTQANADISGCTIGTRAATSVACITDPDFTNLADVEFIQSGAGHALEIDTAGSYDLDGLTFTGYGADASDSAALDITASSGTVTLNVLNGGDTPTYKTAGATVVVVNATTLTLSGLDNPTEVRVYDNTGPTTEIAGQENVTSGTYTVGIDAATYPSVNVAIISLGRQVIFLEDVDMSGGDVSIPVQQQLDRQYMNMSEDPIAEDTFTRANATDPGSEEGPSGHNWEERTGTGTNTNSWGILSNQLEHQAGGANERVVVDVGVDEYDVQVYRAAGSTIGGLVLRDDGTDFIAVVTTSAGSNVIVRHYTGLTITGSQTFGGVLAGTHLVGLRARADAAGVRIYIDEGSGWVEVGVYAPPAATDGGTKVGVLCNNNGNLYDDFKCYPPHGNPG